MTFKMRKATYFPKEVSGLKFQYLETLMKLIQILQGLGPKGMKTQLLLTQHQKRKSKEKGSTHFQLKDNSNFREKDMNIRFKMNGLWQSNSCAKEHNNISNEEEMFPW